MKYIGYINGIWSKLNIQSIMQQYDCMGCSPSAKMRNEVNVQSESK